MFDRIKRGITLPYSEIQQGLAYMRQLEWPNTLADLEAAAKEARTAGSAAVVGFCWGGTVAHVAASDLDIDAAVSYYGGGVAKMLDKQPRCPIMYHVSTRIRANPMPDVEKIKKAYPAACTLSGAQHG
jgi:carboxymethylenebutenolidase